MLDEKKIRSMIEEELLWFEKFAAASKANIYKNDIIEADRRIQRVSAFYEVLEEKPSDDIIYIIDVLKEKLS